MTEDVQVTGQLRGSTEFFNRIGRQCPFEDSTDRWLGWRDIRQ
jgi:hypothetical protein